MSDTGHPFYTERVPEQVNRTLAGAREGEAAEAYPAHSSGAGTAAARVGGCPKLLAGFGVDHDLPWAEVAVGTASKNREGDVSNLALRICHRCYYLCDAVPLADSMMSADRVWAANTNLGGSSSASG